MNPKSIFFLFFFNRRSLPTDIALGIRTQKLACTRHDSSLVSSSPANFIFSFFLFFFFFMLILPLFQLLGDDISFHRRFIHLFFFLSFLSFLFLFLFLFLFFLFTPCLL